MATGRKRLLKHVRDEPPCESGTTPFRIACWPTDAGNPYQRLFYEALAAHGVQLISDANIRLSWLKSHAEHVDAIHLHWPEGLWRSRVFILQLARLIRLWRFLRLARRLRIKTIWTVHNLEHHEGVKWIDRYGYRVLARKVDLVICHSKSAAVTLARRDLPKGQTVVMPHGTYEGIYAAPRLRSCVLRDLGLRDDLPTLCMVGQLRKYKGLDVAVDAVRELRGSVQLIIAGQPNPSGNIDGLRRAISSLPQVALLDRFIERQEYADIVGSSDAVLLPYRKITGSGALLAAWTLERGVVASDLDYFREMAKPEPDAAAFFPNGDAKALANAIRSYLARPLELRRDAVRRLAAQYRWDRCVQPVAEVLQRWMQSNSCRPKAFDIATCVLRKRQTRR